ncbi:hypothetical protein [Elstera litoralis]|uniref:hypothetical protein n=1 Tax=Elstera litoralis TaxID=552518 RepID=UPI0012ED5BB3|nr:hypothetical protein [Elstera litoralis]
MAATVEMVAIPAEVIRRVAQVEMVGTAAIVIVRAEMVGMVEQGVPEEMQQAPDRMAETVETVETAV